jgi:hypothetical protein
MATTAMDKITSIKLTGLLRNFIKMPPVKN